MKKKLISGLFLMLWMALLIAAMVYPQGIFPVLAASGVWVACLLTWAVIPVALAALIKNGPLWQELRGKRAARTVLTGMCYSVGSATRQGSSSLTRFIGQSAMTSRT